MTRWSGWSLPPGCFTSDIDRAHEGSEEYDPDDTPPKGEGVEYDEDYDDGFGPEWDDDED